MNKRIIQESPKQGNIPREKIELAILRMRVDTLTKELKKLKASHRALKKYIKDTHGKHN